MDVDSRGVEERLDNSTVHYPDNRVLRALFRVPVALWRLGLGPALARIEVRGGHLVMLTATGRSSGEPRHTPLTAHTVDGRTYLWCPYGGRSQWYRNVVADPLVTVQARERPRPMRALAVDDADEAVAVVDSLRRFDDVMLTSYLDAEQIPDTPHAIRDNVARLHIRRLVSADEPGPPPLKANLAWLWVLAAGAAAAWAARSR